MFKIKSNKTLSDILSGFSNTVESLLFLMERNSKMVDENRQRVLSLNEDTERLLSENEKAGEVAERLSKLING